MKGGVNMFSNAKEEKQKSIKNAVNGIQALIDNATDKGLNKITFDVDEYYMGEEVQNGLKASGYNIERTDPSAGVVGFQK